MEVHEVDKVHEKMMINPAAVAAAAAAARHPVSSTFVIQLYDAL